MSPKQEYLKQVLVVFNNKNNLISARRTRTARPHHGLSSQHVARSPRRGRGERRWEKSPKQECLKKVIVVFNSKNILIFAHAPPGRASSSHLISAHRTASARRARVVH